MRGRRHQIGAGGRGEDDHGAEPTPQPAPDRRHEDQRGDHVPHQVHQVGVQRQCRQRPPPLAGGDPVGRSRAHLEPVRAGLGGASQEEHAAEDDARYHPERAPADVRRRRHRTGRRLDVELGQRGLGGPRVSGAHHQDELAVPLVEPVAEPSRSQDQGPVAGLRRAGRGPHGRFRSLEAGIRHVCSHGLRRRV